MKRMLGGLTTLVFFAATLLAAPHIWQAAQVNFWSHQFLQGGQAGAPPAAHLRASYWQAAALFGAGDLAGAQKLLAGRQDMPSIHLQSDIFLARSDFSSAAALWQQAGDAQAVLDVAVQAAQAGDSSAAQNALQAAYDLDAQVAALALANSQFNNQQYAAAEAVLRQALQDFPTSARRFDWWLRLGDVLLAGQRWDEAEAAYRAVLAHSDQSWPAHLGLGWVFYERGDGLPAALAELNQVTAQPASQGRGQAAIGQILIREKRFAEAEASFGQAIALDPKVAWWYVVRASAAGQAGNLPLALSILQDALTVFPASAQIYFELAGAYRQDGQSQAALAAIQRALALTAAPTPAFLVRAGEIYEWVGQPAKALDFYRQALNLDPQNKPALSGAARVGK